jgi:hypothetical protein
MHDPSPDHDDRLKDFLSRHGGPGTQAESTGESDGGVRGWSEVYAHDGYSLRCEWSSFGSRKEMTYSEIAPAAKLRD